MSAVNSTPAVAAVSGRAANVSPKHAAPAVTKTPEPQAQTANHVRNVQSGAVINRLDEMVPDIDSYNKQLAKHLDALARDMSNLEQGVARRKAMTDELVRSDGPAAGRHKNPYKQLYAELFRELNSHGPRRIVDVHGNILPQNVAALLKG